MKKIFSILLVFLLLSTIFISCNYVLGEESEIKTKSADSYKNGYRYNVQGWIYLYIEGGPYGRGYQHGYLLSAEIVDAINRWSNVIHNAPVIGILSGQPESSRYEKVSERWWNFLKSRAMRLFWDDYPEEYQQEIKGIAEGVADKGGEIFGEPVTFEDILTLNEMYETMQELVNPQKGIHPLKSLVYSLKSVVPEIENAEQSFISAVLSEPPTHHCSGFIATGDATTNGQVVISQATFFGGWWFTYYIAQRWNVILDIQPTDGHRVIMSTSPGFIWSDENYYQNDGGITFIDTTYGEQGPWMRRGIPFIVRTRMAAQYSDTIDDVIYYLRNKNNGVWPAVWLIGDTKTGEIARLDLGLYEYGLWRTYDGFYWAANNVMDPQVRAEQLRLASLKGRLFQLFHIVFKTEGYQFYTREYRPCDRDLKFEELGKEYYGKIDSEIVKKIMSTPPCGDFSSDTKITDSYLLENNGLWAYWGNTEGIIWNMSNLGLADIFPNILPDVEPAGWVLLYGLPEGHDFTLIDQKKLDYEDDTEIYWKLETDSLNNTDNPRVEYTDGTVCIFTDSGTVYGLSEKNGIKLWINEIGSKPGIPSAFGNMVFVGSDDGLYAFTDTGKVKWHNMIDPIESKPQIADDFVIVGTKNGKIYAFDIPSGNEKWKYNLDDTSMIYLSNSEDNKICAVSDNDCYLLNVRNGEIIWHYEAKGPITSPPTISDKAVYVGSWDTNLYALDVKTGKVLWSFKTGWGIDTTPAIDEDMVFFGSMDNSFYALDRETGDIEWVFNCMASIHSSPPVYGEYVFFGCDDGRFYALNKTTGESVWVLTPGYSLNEDIHNYVTTPILSDPLVVDGRVLFSARGTVYSLDSQTTEQTKIPVLEEDDEIPVETWLFVIVALIIVIFVMAVYLFSSKKKN